MKAETIYWVFSTLPQVLAALTGLVIAGLTIYDQNLRREVGKDDTLGTIIDPLLDNVYAFSRKFFGLSIFSIIIDVVCLYFADGISEITQDFDKLLGCQQAILILAVIIVVGVNILSLLAIFPILNPVLNPNYRNQLTSLLTKEVVTQLNNLEGENRISSSPDKSESESKNNTKGFKQESVKPMIFMDYFRQFEKAVREYFPGSMDKGKREGLTSLLRKLAQNNVISSGQLQDLLPIVKLRNLYAHGGDIGNVNIRIVEFLENTTKQLSDQVKLYLESLRKENLERYFSGWIFRNVDGFEDAANLDHAIRYCHEEDGEHDYGGFTVSRDGDKVTVTTSLGGRKLKLENENQIKLFLHILQLKYSKIPGYSLEEQADFNDALRRSKEEDKKEDNR